MPYPILSASCAFFKAMFHENVSTVAQYFGYSTRGKNINTGNPDPEIEKTIKKLQARQTADGNTATGSTNNDSSTSPAVSDSGQTPSRKGDLAQERLTAKDNSPERPSMRKGDIAYHTSLAENSSTSGPWAAFKETYTRMWKPPRYYPPRGSLAVHGMVRLDSPKGQVFIDVWGWYHPKTDEFHEESLEMRLRGIMPYNQRPRR